MCRVANAGGARVGKGAGNPVALRICGERLERRGEAVVWGVVCGAGGRKVDVRGRGCESWGQVVQVRVVETEGLLLGCPEVAPLFVAVAGGLLHAIDEGMQTGIFVTEVVGVVAGLAASVL